VGVVKTVFWCSAAALIVAAVPAWAELKIGYVNYPQLVQESPQAKVINDALRAEFMPRQRDLQSQAQTLKSREEKLQKDEVTMTEDQRAREESSLRESEREFQRKQTEFQDDVNARRQEEISRLQRTIAEEVKSYAKAQNFDLVLADGVIYSTPAIDLTAAVLQALQSHSAKPATPSGSSGSAKPSRSGATTH
jgi:outer membrane protein